MRGLATWLALLMILPATPAGGLPNDHVQLLGRGTYWYDSKCEAEIQILVEKRAEGSYAALFHATPEPLLDCDALTYLFIGVLIAPLQTVCLLQGDWTTGMAGSCLYGWLQIGPYGDGSAVPIYGEKYSFRVAIWGDLRDARLDEALI